MDSMTVEHYANTFDINVRGTVFMVQKAVHLLNEGASVVLSGSTSATNGTAGFSVYAASKAAVRSFGRTWAAELADRNIGSTPSSQARPRTRESWARRPARRRPPASCRCSLPACPSSARLSPTKSPTSRSSSPATRAAI